MSTTPISPKSPTTGPSHDHSPTSPSINGSTEAKSEKHSRTGSINKKEDTEAQLASNDVEAPINPRAAKGISNVTWVLTLIGLYLGALLYGLDTTIAADIQGSVYERFQDIQNLPWVGLGFPMASVATILIQGRLYRDFNTKWLVLTAVVLFEVGSAVCGAAPTMIALIVGRVIAGVGGAGMYLGALTYVSHFATPSEAALLNAIMGLSWGIGAILGPVVGGAFSDSSATWRWAFYINLPLAAIFSPVYIFVFPSSHPRPNEPLGKLLKQIDWIGSILFGAALVLFMVVVSFSGSTFAWGSGADIALWVVWGLVLIALLVQQGFPLFTTREEQIFPVHFLKSRIMVLLFISTAGAAAANAVTLYYIPLYFQFTNGDSALKAAVRLLPFILVFVVFVLIAGGSLPAVGRYSIYYVFGGVLTIIGGALLSTIDQQTSVAKIYGYEILIAVGSGLTFQNAYAVAAAKVTGKDKANAIGYINVSQIGTIAMGLAIAGAVFQNVGFMDLKRQFAGFGFPDEYVRSALAGTISPLIRSGQAEIVNIAVRSVAHTLAKVFILIPVAGAVLFVAGALMRHEKISLDIVAGG